MRLLNTALFVQTYLGTVCRTILLLVEGEHPHEGHLRPDFRQIPGGQSAFPESAFS